MSTSTSKYRGVSWDKNAREWRVQLMVHGVVKRVRGYQKEIDAAFMYDRLAKECFANPILNFLPGGVLNPERKRRGRLWTRPPKTAFCPCETKSTFRGVHWSHHQRQWRVQLRRASLCEFYDKPEDAALAYDRAAKEVFVNPVLNFLPDGSLNPLRRCQRPNVARLRKHRANSASPDTSPSDPGYTPLRRRRGRAASSVNNSHKHDDAASTVLMTTAEESNHDDEEHGPRMRRRVGRGRHLRGVRWLFWSDDDASSSMSVTTPEVSGDESYVPPRRRDNVPGRSCRRISAHRGCRGRDVPMRRPSDAEDDGKGDESSTIYVTTPEQSSEEDYVPESIRDGGRDGVLRMGRRGLQGAGGPMPPCEGAGGAGADDDDDRSSTIYVTTPEESEEEGLVAPCEYDDRRVSPVASHVERDNGSTIRVTTDEEKEGWYNEESWREYWVDPMSFDDVRAGGDQNGMGHAPHDLPPQRTSLSPSRCEELQRQHNGNQGEQHQSDTVGESTEVTQPTMQGKALQPSLEQRPSCISSAPTHRDVVKELRKALKKAKQQTHGVEKHAVKQVVSLVKKKRPDAMRAAVREVLEPLVHASAGRQVDLSEESDVRWLTALLFRLKAAGRFD